LPVQHVTCNVGTRGLGSTFTYSFPAHVRGEVPNGTKLTIGTITARSTRNPVPAVAQVALAPGYTNPCSRPGFLGFELDIACATVSARPKADITLNSYSTVPNTGYAYFPFRQLCPAPGNPTRQCSFGTFPVSITIPQGGRGSTPISSSFTFTDDLSPQEFFPAAGAAAWAAMNANPARYGVEMAGCGASNIYSEPAARIGYTATATERNSVRETGTWSCTQAGPGQPISITASGADTTGNTCPAEMFEPIGGVIPSDQCVIIVGYIAILVPSANIEDFGVEFPVGSGNRTIAINHRLEDFAPVGIDASPNTGDLAFNNATAWTLRAQPEGSFAQYYVGVPNVAANTPEVRCAAGYQIYECAPGQTALQSGDGLLLPGQEVISLLDMRNFSSAPFNRTWMVCDVWDASLMELAPGNYGPPSDGTYGALARPSNGAAAWASAWYAFDGFGSGANLYDGGNRPTTIFEYGNGAVPVGPDAGGNQSRCSDSDSPNGWFANPADVTNG
jgi:hypothetical protein